MKNQPPIIIEVLRGKHVESTHAVDAVICDAAGNVVQAFGEIDKRIYPRSAVKAMQALPLVESGAADHFGFADRHIALACASHNGEKFHVSCAEEMLKLAGLDETCLECGAHVPLYTGKFTKTFHENPTSLHNNCSGKHSGFAAYATHIGIKTEGYIGFDHAVQREIAAVMESITGADHRNDNYAIDGCSIPTWQIPMAALATGFARIATGDGQGATRAKAMQRIVNACFAHPEMVAGTGRVCTDVMKALPNKAFVKVGAEGVYTASLPEKGFGIAMKARDGNPRAAEVALCTLLNGQLDLNQAQKAEMQKLANPVLKNWNGIEVGRLRVAG